MPFGGRYRQIMVYVDPLKLEAHQLSVMDVVRTVNNANLILPAGDVKIGPYDYNLYVNSQINDMKDINQVPLKTIDNAPVVVGDVGYAVDGARNPIQRRARGRPAVGLSAGAQTGRRRQHHPGCGWHQEFHCPPVRRAQTARDQSRLRPVRFRAQRH